MAGQPEPSLDTIAVGGVESLIELPAAMTHEPLSAAEREALGISDTLLRVSVGIEGTDDLIAELKRGFAAMNRRATPPSTDP